MIFFQNKDEDEIECEARVIMSLKSKHHAEASRNKTDKIMTESKEI